MAGLQPADPGGGRAASGERRRGRRAAARSRAAPTPGRTRGLRLATLGRPEHDPLFWTGLLGNATVFLLVRDDLPLAERLASAAARARLLPRLAGQARAALASGDPARIAREPRELAARQARASALFYREGFPGAAGGAPELRAALAAAGGEAAAALEALAAFLEELAQRAAGSPSLGERYAERFRIVTGLDRPPDEVLAEAERALTAKRAETAAYGRTVWREVLGDEPLPGEEAALVRRLFARIAEDRARGVEEFVEEYRRLIRESTEFVRRRDIRTR